MSRSVGWGLLLGVLVAPIPAAAQPATVALLCVGACPAPPFDAGLPMFVSTLRDAGYVDGQNVVLDPRGIGDTPEQLPMLATQLVRRKVDVVVAIGAAAVVAARRASATVPVVMLHVPNAVELGLVASLARPGGNVTGVTFPLAELSAKHLELLRPADIPVEQPTRYELVVNLATAKAIGVTVPPSVLARADEVVQ
jgi:ABC-type uncharacterized transport system substrate-binding protein